MKKKYEEDAHQNFIVESSPFDETLLLKQQSLISFCVIKKPILTYIGTSW